MSSSAQAKQSWAGPAFGGETRLLEDSGSGPVMASKLLNHLSHLHHHHPRKMPQPNPTSPVSTLAFASTAQRVTLVSLGLNAQRDENGQRLENFMA
ncbi:leucine-rich repeat-containing protein 75A [Platysternon megacephalum]|uniref:Leucine-rich repeat-containing protein 75A n=1 Tax=Platysternon megacephalum TaxID=55544 RepID=A0A4D9ERM7_9SAUR|nr:leucine-rich repeat-containing protein 75A [Platysternon megacephalum]